MAARPIWRGHLQLALVTCPVALHSAHRPGGGLRFRLINPKTGHRVRMLSVDAETDAPLARGDLVRGYEFEKDRYVILEDVDFDAAQVESSSVMTIDKFVDSVDIAPMYYEASYYAAPDGELGRDVYAVLRQAMADTGKVALSRVVISRRERRVAIKPMGDGMVVHTLHQKAEVNDPKELFDAVGDQVPDPDMVQLAEQLIARQSARFEPTDMEDRYEIQLREVIAAKLKGEGITTLAAAPRPGRENVVDLMAALKASLGHPTSSAERPQADKHPARSAPRKRAAAESTGRSARKRA